MSTAFKLFKGSTLQTFSLFLNIVVFFFLLPFIIEQLGERLYGLWALVASFTGYYFLLDFGISQAVSRYVAKYVGEGSKKKIDSIVSNAFFLFLGIAVLAVIVSVILSMVIGNFVPDDLSYVAGILVLIVGLEFAVSLPFRTFEGVMKANLDFDKIAFFEIGKTLFRTLLMYVMLVQGYGIVSLAIANFIGNFVYFILTYFYTKYKHTIYINFSLFNKKEIKKLFGFSSKIIITQFGDILRFKIDFFVITAFLGLTAVGIYAIASKIAEYFQNMMMKIVNVLNPLMAQNKGKGDIGAISENYFFGIRLATIFSFYVILNLAIFGKYLIITWVSSNFLSAYLPMMILCIGFAIALSQMSGIGVLHAIGKPGIYAKYNVIEGVLNIILTLFLVQEFGLIGVAFGTLIPMIFIRIFVLPRHIASKLNVSILTYYIKLINIYFLSFLSYGLLYLITTYFFSFFNNIIQVGIVFLLINVGVILVTYFVIMTSDEKKILRGVVLKQK